MLHSKLHLNRFRQSESTRNFKDHYGIVNDFAQTGARVLKLGRGYFDWQFYVRPLQVEKQLGRDVHQLQGYLSPLGERDTREALLALERHFGKYSIENIAFTSSVLTTFPRISELIRTLKSEELVIATPNYPQLEEDALRHGPIRLVGARRENGYNLSAKEIEASLSANTSGVVLLNPSVVGIYQDAKELGRIVSLLCENNIFLILDETNDTVSWSSGGLKLSESGRPRIVRPYPDNIDSDCVIRMRSFSKGDMLAEYRTGYVVAMPLVISALEQSVGANTPPASATEAVKWLSSTYGRWASGDAAPLDDDERSFIREMGVNASLMDSLRQYVSREILKVQGAEILPPQNGFNLFFRIEGYGSWALFEKLLYEGQFAVNPGSCFGLPDDEGWVRITLANAPDKLQTAMNRLVTMFPSQGAPERFTFSDIESVRTWENCPVELSQFLS